MKYTTLIWHLRRDNPRQLKMLLDNSDGTVRISHYLRRMGFQFDGIDQDETIGTIWVEPDGDGYSIIDHELYKI